MDGDAHSASSNAQASVTDHGVSKTLGCVTTRSNSYKTPQMTRHGSALSRLRSSKLRHAWCSGALRFAA